MVEPIGNADGDSEFFRSKNGPSKEVTFNLQIEIFASVKSQLHIPQPENIVQVTPQNIMREDG